MIKCEVLGKASLVIEKGSVVFVDERQFELARGILKPVVQKSEPKEEEPKEAKPKSKSKK